MDRHPRQPSGNGDSKSLGEVPEGARWRVVVIDDDPTGCQTVSEIPVITRWDEEDLRWLLTRERPLGFVLTNSRAMHAEEAAAASSDIVRRCLALGAELGLTVSVLSRSDSTLRGHFTAEVDAVCRAFELSGAPVDLVLLAPAFFEAGRETRDDTHYVLDSGLAQPVASTAYAQDPAFGFAESNLVSWVRARLGEPDAAVQTLPLGLLRDGGVEAVTKRLALAARGRRGVLPPVVIANGTCQEDYDIIAQAVRGLEEHGMRIVTRCGPSYVASRLGEPVPSPLHGPSAVGTVQGPGLVVVGSHVPVSTAQLARLVGECHPVVLELDPVEVTGPDRSRTLTQLTDAVCEGLGAGSDVVLATSRRLMSVPDVRGNIEIAAAMSGAINEVVIEVLAQRNLHGSLPKGGSPRR